MSEEHKMTTKDKVWLGVTLAAIFGGIFFLGLINKHIYHELCQGWHFKTLLIARIVPLIIPFSSITLIAYAEQVG